MEKQSESNPLSNHPLQITYSNDLSLLAQKLGEELFLSGLRPFETRWIVVPHGFWKEYLFHAFLSNPKLKLAAGVRILPLNRALLEIGDDGGSRGKKIPSFIELSLFIEAQLHSEKMKDFPELIEYIGAQEDVKRARRIAVLSDQLARLFARYGLYGEKFLSKWLAKSGWQQALWNEIFSIDSSWTYPLALFQKSRVKSFSGKIALFGFSYLPKAYLTFFHSLDASIYSISPCAFFWEDQTSDRQRLFLQKSLRKRGVKKNVREQLSEYMQDHHPLLGNWGKLGQDMLKSLDGFFLHEVEAYREPEAKRLLDQLKQSLLFLDEKTPLELDDSLQLHSATSKLREVEILRDLLETLLQKQNDLKDPISPREILVVSPDIAAYAPYIRMVFSQSPFSIAIEGLSLCSISEAVQGFLQWMRLPEMDFSLPAVSKLLSNEPFIQKCGFSSDEVYRLNKWFKDAHILRGLKEHQNSWEKGLARLLYGLAVIPTEEGDFSSWPLASVSHSEIELLDRFLKLFSEMQSDFCEFLDSKYPVQWFEFFLQMADKYFSIEWEREPFFQELKALAISCKKLQELKLDFDSISRVMDHLMQKPTAEISSAYLQKITFAPLMSSHLVDVRILYCLGMDEGAFPHAEVHSSLCEMQQEDHYPSKTDEDRAAFLDLLIKARDFLIFSYLRVHPEDGKQQEPSLLIEELQQYLVKRGLESMFKIEHPALPFDQSYFSQEAKVKKWQRTDYLAAQAYYREKPTLFPFFSKKAVKSDLEEIFIDIRQLKKLARSPLQFYFNETLKIYLEEKEDEEETEFVLSHLRKSILRKKALQSNLPQVMRRLRAQGALPQGLFQEAAMHELEEDLRDLFSELDTFGVNIKEITVLQLSAACQESDSQKKCVPPLRIPLKDSKVAYLTGSLEDICPRGLLYHGDKDLKTLIRAWPLYLIYLCLYPENQPLLLTKKGAIAEFSIADPKAELASYIEYYLQAKQEPSLLMPEWAKACLEGTLEEMKLSMDKDSKDIYVNFLKRRNGLLDLLERIGFWQAVYQRTFRSLISFV